MKLSTRRWRTAAAAALCILGAGCESVRETIGLKEKPHGPPELRATWVVASTLVGERAVETIVEDARERLHTNAVFVQARARGDAYYLGGTEPRPKVLKAGDFDPLEEAIDEGGSDVAEIGRAHV